MSDNTKMPSVSGLNLFGTEPSQLQPWIDAQEAGIKALEQRYSSPNYFNIAAGFFKPQLGGFGASLGSAAQAYGDTVEKERESQLPIAKMRAELALSKIAMDQRLKAAALTERSIKAGAPTPQDTATVIGLVGNADPAAQALTGQVTVSQREQELRTAAMKANQERYIAERDAMLARAKRE